MSQKTILSFVDNSLWGVQDSFKTKSHACPVDLTTFASSVSAFLKLTVPCRFRSHQFIPHGFGCLQGFLI